MEIILLQPYLLGTFQESPTKPAYWSTARNGRGREALRYTQAVRRCSHKTREATWKHLSHLLQR